MAFSRLIRILDKTISICHIVQRSMNARSSFRICPELNSDDMRKWTSAQRHIVRKAQRGRSAPTIMAPPQRSRRDDASGQFAS
jgi:hypothetical protein